jgi:His/Glu/Gln/Arg/opine family amino acid ABC transporter permease subunit
MSAILKRVPGSAGRLRPGESAQALAGVVVLLLLLPVLFHMEARNFAVYANAYAWNFLWLGLQVTLLVAIVSIALSLPLATLFALGRLTLFPGLRWPAIAVIEGVRALPILLFIYFIGRGMTRSGLDGTLSNSPFGSLLKSGYLSQLNMSVSALVPVVVALTLYTTAVNAETIRSGILSLDQGQTEAGLALGLSYAQRMRLVILPQAFRRVLPPLIAQFATVVKDTSLGYIVTLLELTRRGVILYQDAYNPMETIYIVAVIYFAINYVLGQVAQGVERRLNAGRRAGN